MGISNVILLTGVSFGILIERAKEGWDLDWNLFEY